MPERKKWIKNPLLHLSGTYKIYGCWWINANTRSSHSWSRSTLKSCCNCCEVTFLCTKPYFSHAVGGYFSLSFTVTVPGMITPATM